MFSPLQVTDLESMVVRINLHGHVSEGLRHGLVTLTCKVLACFKDAFNNHLFFP